MFQRKLLDRVSPVEYTQRYVIPREEVFRDVQYDHEVLEKGSKIELHQN